MILTERYHQSPHPVVDRMMNHVRLLVNKAQYLILQDRAKLPSPNHKSSLESPYELCSAMKNDPVFQSAKGTRTTGLTVTSCQQILRQVAKNWSNYHKAVAAYFSKQPKQGPPPKPPGYHTKTYRGKRLAPVYFDAQDVHTSNGYFWFAKELSDLKFKVGRADMSQNHGARILPSPSGYIIELLYDSNEPKTPQKARRVAAIDLGVNYLVTLVSNIKERPLIFRGGKIKSLNNYYNKQRAKLQAQYDKQGVRRGRRLALLGEKRKRKIDDHFHKLSRRIINWCLSHKIDTLVVGYIPGWKQFTKLGNITNQNFVFIPHARLLFMLRYKSQLAGIHFLTPEESYTSKCSFMDMEKIAKKQKGKYFGTRNGSQFQSRVGGTHSSEVQSSTLMSMLRVISEEKRLETLSSIPQQSSVIIPLPSKYDTSFDSTSPQSHVDGRPHYISYHHPKIAPKSQYHPWYTCLDGRGLVTRPVVSPLRLVLNYQLS